MDSETLRLYKRYIARVQSVLDAVTGHLPRHYTEAAEGDMFVGEQTGALDYLLIGMTEESYRPPDDVLETIQQLIDTTGGSDQQRFQGFYDRITAL